MSRFTKRLTVACAFLLVPLPALADYSAPTQIAAVETAGASQPSYVKISVPQDLNGCGRGDFFVLERQPEGYYREVMAMVLAARFSGTSVRMRSGRCVGGYNALDAIVLE